jgi:hypothetical protein
MSWNCQGLPEHLAFAKPYGLCHRATASLW